MPYDPEEDDPIFTQGGAVMILSWAYTPSGLQFPMVQDPDKPAPLYWKFPIGRLEDGEHARAGGRREFLEETGAHETGFDFDADDLIYVARYDRGNHIQFVYALPLQDLNGVGHTGQEGERVDVFGVEKLMEADFFRPQREVIDDLLEKGKLNLIRP
jgi:8-oxo-dGTP pyrophosphatase MutT (NUDIX family)